MVVTVFSGATTPGGDGRLDSRLPRADYADDFFNTQLVGVFENGGH